MLKLVLDVAEGLIVTALIVAGLTFRMTGKLTSRPQGQVSRIDAATILWRAYVVNMQVVLSNTMFWGLMGVVTAFWIVASMHGWLR